VTPLERTFLDLAVQKKKLSLEQRDQVEAACARAVGEGQELRPWRATFVRGFLSKGEVDALLQEASTKLEDEGSAVSEVQELSKSATDEGLDYRIGILALQSGVVTEEQLERGLAAQRKSRKTDKTTRKLETVLVEEGIVSPAIMEGILLLQERLREQEEKESSATQAIAADLRFGQVAIDARLLDEKALKRALADQKRRSPSSGPRGRKPSVGDILIEQGALTREARDLVLELQERRSSRPVAPPPTSRAAIEEQDRIGRLLVENRLVDEAQVKKALDLQSELRTKEIDRKLGDLLVLQGAIDRPTLETVLKTQTVRRKAPGKRRRLLREDSLPEHPLTLLLAVALALVLSAAYVLATDGKRAILEAVNTGESPKPSGGPGAEPPNKPR
jgi:hypothetical protein